MRAQPRTSILTLYFVIADTTSARLLILLFCFLGWTHKAHVSEDLVWSSDADFLIERRIGGG